MKTKTYLRLSLLIPFLVWILCVLMFVIWSRLAPAGYGFDGWDSLINIILLPLMFYVFGIIGWLIPYVVLSIILLFWSLRSTGKALLKVFAWSPLGMAAFVLLFVNILGSRDLSQVLSDPASNAANFLGYTALFAGLTLFWGYFCVGVGYALYKILRRRGFLIEEPVTSPMPIQETS